MTRPDPRLLLPASCLPLVPEGARVWCVGIPGVSLGMGTAVYPTVGVAGVRLVAIERHDLVDLSAPALRDGVAERVDVLPWALAVLVRDGWRFTAAALRDHDADLNLWKPDVEAAHRKDVRHGAIGTLPLDVGNAHTRNAAARAVVVAALLARGTP